MPSPFRRCPAPLLGLALVLVCALGCRQAPLLDLTNAQRPTDRTPLDPRLLAALESMLRDGEWKRIPNASLLDLAAHRRAPGTSVEVPVRWQFVAAPSNPAGPSRTTTVPETAGSPAALVRGQTPAAQPDPHPTAPSADRSVPATKTAPPSTTAPEPDASTPPIAEPPPNDPDPSPSLLSLEALLDRLDDLASHRARSVAHRTSLPRDADADDGSADALDSPDDDRSPATDVEGDDGTMLDQDRGPSGSGRALSLLAERDDVVGWNAALIWGRRAPLEATAVLPVLERLATRTSTGPMLRAAAAEAWCLAAARARGEIEENLAPVGRALQDPLLPVDVRCELFRGLGPHVPPDRIPHLADAFDEATRPAPPVELRRAAVDACLLHALCAPPRSTTPDPIPQDDETRDESARLDPLPARRGERTDGPGDTSADFDEFLWPQAIERCAWDADPLVRRTYGRWLVLARAPHAFSVLVAQLADLDRRVRDDALLGLGVLGTSDARDELVRQSKRPEELVRALAVRGLAGYGFDAVAAAETDRTATVRSAFASACAELPAAPAAIALCRLSTDPDLQVQRAATEAVRGWPDELAVPVLLHVLQESALATRRLALADLRARVGHDEPVRLDGTPHERREAAQRIAARAGVPLDLLRAARTGSTRSATAPSSQEAAEIESAVRALSDPASTPAVRDSALARLRQLERSDLPTVEDLLLRDPTLRPRELLHDVLPALDERHAALRDLESDDVFVRRRGTGRLAQLSTSATLPPFVVVRLAELLTREQDRLVWHHAMNAVGPDASDEGARLALLALNHVWPDIRLLGCRHVARHGRPQHGPWLMPLFDDRDPSVRLAAVEAAGACRNPLVLSDRPGGEGTVPLRGLRALLAETEPRMQLAVLAAMSRLGDPVAMDELVRLGFHESAARRIAVARTMAETGRARFVEPLVRWAWTESDDHVRRAILLALRDLVPSDEQPPGIDRAPTDRDRVRTWVAWREARGRDNRPAATGAAAHP